MDQTDVKRIVADLQREWGGPGGFLYDFRDAKFNKHAFDRTLATLQSIDFGEDALVPRELIAEIWEIPLFLECNYQIVIERGGDHRTVVDAKILMTHVVEQKIEGAGLVGRQT